MVDISVQIEGQSGLNWAQWKQLVRAVEGLGFVGVYRSDHFTNMAPPEQDALETVVSLTYLADHTQRVDFGTLVAPLSFRDPIMLARQAIALDNLSGGRMVLGVGAGWQEHEHEMFGYKLGDIATRMARFQEGLEVINLLLRGSGPATFEGRFYQLHEAQLLPRPEHAGSPRIMIGGVGLKRTLPLVARYADVWNAPFLMPDAYRNLSGELDRLLLEAGRRPEQVKRTLMYPLHFAGEPEAVIAQIQAFGEAGVQEIMWQWPDGSDIAGLLAAAEPVLKQLQ